MNESKIERIDREIAECEARGLAAHHAPSLHIRHEPKLDARLSDEERAEKIRRLDDAAKRLDR